MDKTCGHKRKVIFLGNNKQKKPRLESDLDQNINWPSHDEIRMPHPEEFRNRKPRPFMPSGNFPLRKHANQNIQTFNHGYHYPPHSNNFYRHNNLGHWKQYQPYYSAYQYSPHHRYPKTNYKKQNFHSENKVKKLGTKNTSVCSDLHKDNTNIQKQMSVTSTSQTSISAVSHLQPDKPALCSLTEQVSHGQIGNAALSSQKTNTSSSQALVSVLKTNNAALNPQKTNVTSNYQTRNVPLNSKNKTTHSQTNIASSSSKRRKRGKKKTKVPQTQAAAYNSQEKTPSVFKSQADNAISNNQINTAHYQTNNTPLSLPINSAASDQKNSVVKKKINAPTRQQANLISQTNETAFQKAVSVSSDPKAIIPITSKACNADSQKAVSFDFLSHQANATVCSKTETTASNSKTNNTNSSSQDKIAVTSNPRTFIFVPSHKSVKDMSGSEKKSVIPYLKTENVALNPPTPVDSVNKTNIPDSKERIVISNLSNTIPASFHSVCDVTVSSQQKTTVLSSTQPCIQTVSVLKDDHAVLNTLKIDPVASHSQTSNAASSSKTKTTIDSDFPNVSLETQVKILNLQTNLGDNNYQEDNNKVASYSQNMPNKDETLSSQQKTTVLSSSHSSIPVTSLETSNGVTNSPKQVPVSLSQSGSVAQSSQDKTISNSQAIISVPSFPETTNVISDYQRISPAHSQTGNPRQNSVLLRPPNPRQSSSFLWPPNRPIQPFNNGAIQPFNNGPIRPYNNGHCYLSNFNNSWQPNQLYNSNHWNQYRPHYSANQHSKSHRYGKGVFSHKKNSRSENFAQSRSCVKKTSDPQTNNKNYQDKITVTSNPQAVISQPSNIISKSQNKTVSHVTPNSHVASSQKEIASSSQVTTPNPDASSSSKQKKRVAVTCSQGTFPVQPETDPLNPQKKTGFSDSQAVNAARNNQAHNASDSQTNNTSVNSQSRSDVPNSQINVITSPEDEIIIEFDSCKNVTTIQKKLVIVGDGACGKTCLLWVLKENKFPTECSPNSFENQAIQVKVGTKNVGLTLCDMACKEGNDGLQEFYSNSDLVLICFSIDNPDSLQNVLKKWILEVVRYCKDTPIILVGNKKDLRNDWNTISRLAKTKQKPVPYDKGLTVAGKIQACDYLECSSLTKEGVQEIMRIGSRATLHKMRPECVSVHSQENTNVTALSQNQTVAPSLLGTNTSGSMNKIISLENEADSTSELCSNISSNLVIVPSSPDAMSICDTTYAEVTRVSKVTTNLLIELTDEDDIAEELVSLKNDIEDDVHYLYTVEPDEGKLVELVDLSEESQVVNQDLAGPTLKNSYVSVNSESIGQTIDDSSDLVNDFESEKNNTAGQNGIDGGAYCSLCRKNYLELHKQKFDLYLAKCGHLFCISCVMLRNKCVQCKMVITNLRKIVL